MTTFPNSPKVLKGGLVLIDAESGRVLRIISIQYNPDSLSRTLQIQAAGGEGGQRSDELTESAGRRLRITLPEGVPVGHGCWLRGSSSPC